MRLGRDLLPLGRPFTMADVQGAVDAVAPAIEVVDDRGCDYASLDAVSLIADNAWNAGIVHGEFRAAWPELDAVHGEVFVDGSGAPLYRGRAATCSATRCSPSPGSPTILPAKGRACAPAKW